MGFFSQDCIECGHPALCRGATNAINAWMSDVVVHWPNGDRVSGEYDGYGTVGSHEYAIGHGENCVRHRACWEAAGRPEYTGPSRDSRDQGWFFEEGAHDMSEPR